MSRSKRILLATMALFLFAAPYQVHAAGVPENIAQYASRHGVEVKQVTRRVGTRQIRRIFVPILSGQEEMFQDFTRTFLTHDTMLLFARPSRSSAHPYHHYVRAAFKQGAGDAVVWASASDVGPKATEARATSGLQVSEGSRTVVLKVGQTAAKNAQDFLHRFHTSYNFSLNIQTYKQAMEQENKIPGDCTANCMWWLTNLNMNESSAASPKNLMQLLGTKRTRGPQEMPPLAIHAARNELVEVVGVGVATKEAFNAMGTNELMGPTPTRGDKASWVRD